MGSKGNVMPRNPDIVRMLILNKDRNLLCMVKNGRGWDLPNFYYKDSISNGHRIDLCYEDLMEWLGDTVNGCDLSFAVELIGSQWALHFNGHKTETVGIKLLLVDWHSEDATFIPCLPSGAAWKDLKSVEEIIRAQRTKKHSHILSIAKGCMQPDDEVLRSLADPRFKPGWYKEAKYFLTETVTADGAETTGRVIQHHLSATSTITKVNSSKGWYFLKAPALGCNEVRITVEVASLFGDLVPSVVSSSHLLNCFVSQEFSSHPLDVKDLLHIAPQFADLQKASVPHVDRLVNIGCPVRDLDDLITQMKMWIRGVGITATRNCKEARTLLRELLPLVKELGDGLIEYNIPKTLVHGDFALGNLTNKGDIANGQRGFLLFDWQFAYIGHPFCDFHRLYKDVSEQVITHYLYQWTSFESMERLRKAFEKAWKLGWFFRLISIAEWHQACNPQWRSCLQMWAIDIIKSLHDFFYGEESQETSNKSSSLFSSSSSFSSLP